jgi:TnpA family transposase
LTETTYTIYHLSDNYIALFSRFIPCGVYEAIYILDPFFLNKSVVQPNTIHADTHGQSLTVFGRAFLLGIQLMPRMLNGNILKYSDHPPTLTKT